MPENFDDLVQVNSSGPRKIVLDAQNGKISITGVKRMPSLDSPSIEAGQIEIDAKKLKIVLRNGILEGADEFVITFSKGLIQIGKDLKFGSGSNQILILRNEGNEETIRVYGHGVLAVGGKGNDGRIYLVDSNKNDNVILDALENGRILFLDDHRQTNFAIHGNIRSGMDDLGNIEIWGESEDGRRYQSLFFNAKHSYLKIGDDNESGGIVVQGPNGNEINIDGNTGDIRLSGSDCAEQFEVCKNYELEPGTVTILDDNMKIKPCNKAYDNRVAGVVSGANSIKPGIILNNSATQGQNVPLALNGKVYCKVDAKFDSIKTGDLLTTSNTYGYAMKANDRELSFGSVLGKAMGNLKKGKDLIPVLVALG